MKNFIVFLITLSMLGGILIAPMYAVEYGEEITNNPEKEYSQTFKDVPASHWAFSYIAEMSERGVISGYPNGYYYPSNAVSRAEFAKIMALAAGLEIKPVTITSYTDVSSSDWYAPYVEAAKYYLSGYNYPNNQYYYKPADNALREDIAVALVKLKGYDTTGFDISILKAMFTDYKSISDEAQKYVAVAVDKGLISGYEDNTFRGQDTITRAEAATLLWRAYQYGNGNKDFDSTTKPTSTPTPTAAPTQKPTATSTPAPTDAPVDEPGWATCGWGVDTLVPSVDKVDSLIAINGGVAYISGNKVYIVRYDNNGEVEIAFDAEKDLEWQGEETSKSDKLVNTIKSIGFNFDTNILYMYIYQRKGVGGKTIIYNITDQEIIFSSSDLRIQSAENRFTDGTLAFGGFYSNGNMLVGSDIITPSGGLGYSGENLGLSECGYLFVYNDILYVVGGSDSFSKLNPASNSLVNIDTDRGYIDVSVDVFFCDKTANLYFTNHDSKTIEKMNLNGDSSLLLDFTDVYAFDSMTINLNWLNRNNTVVGDDESVTFWDSSYKCLRRISRIE